MDDGPPRRKPVPLRRRSFGSQNGVGIWWRKQSVPTEETDDATGVTSDGNSTCSSGSSNGSPIDTGSNSKTASPSLDNATEENAVIGWDDDLCRPIYYHRTVSSGNTDLVDDSDGEEEFDVLNDTVPTTTSENVSVGDDGDEKAEIDDTFRIPGTTRTRTKTFGNRGKRQRPVSLILTEDNTDPEDEEEAAPDRESRRISLSPPTTTAKSNNIDFNSDIATPETTTKSRGNRRSSKKQRTDDEELEKARDYFANLDETQALTLDAAVSPTISSRITRTSRKTDLNSPGINRSYQAYSESIRSDGLSPLSIKDYASSRRLHFLNKGEIVDGFLDD